VLVDPVLVAGSDPDIEERIFSMRNQGRRPGDPWLRHTRVGFNYRLDEMSAALGVAQMRRIEEILGNRARAAAWYEERLAGIPGVALPTAAEWADPAWFVEFLRVGDGLERDRLIESLESRGIESKAYFDLPLHRQPPYAGREDLAPTPLPVTETASSQIMILPFSSVMTEAEVDRVSSALREAVDAERGR
jgi:dTDP-4-amino-4,6-dideoxygalactose transaminase